jgi:hypothetical protein
VTTSERWARTERLYHEALAYGANERAAFLSDACAGDDALRREVESLLAHDGGAAFLSTPAVPNGISLGVRIGQALGPYVISQQIGEGGMGEVYRARDTKLGRDVAIKILPHAFTADPDRLARFEREARLLASLNHPHIGAIYGVEALDGVPALVLELVEGETLAQALWRRGRGRGPADSRDPCDRPADCRGARCGARTRNHPSGFEAREYQDHTRGHREGPRLRSGEGGRR